MSDVQTSISKLSGHFNSILADLSADVADSEPPKLSLSVGHSALIKSKSLLSQLDDVLVDDSVVPSASVAGSGGNANVDFNTKMTGASSVNNGGDDSATSGLVFLMPEFRLCCGASIGREKICFCNAIHGGCKVALHESAEKAKLSGGVYVQESGRSHGLVTPFLPFSLVDKWDQGFLEEFVQHDWKSVTGAQAAMEVARSCGDEQAFESVSQMMGHIQELKGKADAFKTPSKKRSMRLAFADEVDGVIDDGRFAAEGMSESKVPRGELKSEGGVFEDRKPLILFQGLSLDNVGEYSQVFPEGLWMLLGQWRMQLELCPRRLLLGLWLIYSRLPR